MLDMRFKYAAEKLAEARRNLMAPHPRGEAESFVGAFRECDQALKSIRLKDLDDGAQSWAATIARVIHGDPYEAITEDAWLMRAERLTADEKRDFSTAVDQLADRVRGRFKGER
jgi:hypothetical protein